MKHLAFLLLFGIIGWARSWAGWVNETAYELATQGDWNGDGMSDLLVVDRESGTLRVGLVDSSGVITWLQAAPTGAIGTSSIAFGQFSEFALSYPALAVTSPALNRVHLMRSQQADPVPWPTNGIGPGALVTVLGGPGLTSGSLVVESEMNNEPDVWQIGHSSAFATAPTGARLARGNESSSSGEFGFIARNPSEAGTDTFGLYQPPVDYASVLEPYLLTTGLPLDCDWVVGEFADNLTSTSFRSSFLFWKTGQASLIVRGLDRFSSPLAFDPSITYTLAHGIEQLTVLNGTLPPRLLVIYTGGTEAAVYDYDGDNTPALAHVLAPESGQTFRHALATDGGDFHLFSGPTGSTASTSARRWRHQPDGSYLPDAPSSMSPLYRGNRRTNLLLYQGEPFVDDNAKIVSALSARDWTTGATGQPMMIQATAETYQGTLNGLGIPQSILLGMSRFSASHTLPNQIAADVSVIIYSPPVGQANPAIQFSPPPGRYSGPVSVSIKGGNISYPYYIHYRTSADEAWKYYYPATSPPILVSADATIQAFVERYGNDRTPFINGAYTIGSNPSAPTSGTDANHNGLGDEWERYFGLTDPDDDADGDGYTNKQEHDSLTDPDDPASHPNPLPDLPVLLITSVSPSTGIVTLQLQGTPAKSYRIERSPSLLGGSWQPLGNDILMPIEGAVELQDTRAPSTRYFYRAKGL